MPSSKTASFNATYNIIFHNYDMKLSPSFAVTKAMGIVHQSNIQPGESKKWELIFKDGDHTRYERTISKDSNPSDIAADYHRINKPPSDEERLARLKRANPTMECQVILHDVPEANIRQALDIIHQLGWRIQQDIKITFIKGPDTVADFTIHRSTPSETLDILDLTYKAGGESQLRRTVDECKNQLSDLEKSSGTLKGLAAQRSAGKRGTQTFKKGLGAPQIERIGEEFIISFPTGGRDKNNQLNAAVNAFNRMKFFTLTENDFAVNEKGQLSLKAEPPSAWTMALAEIQLQQQKESRRR